jgi:[ribosomal protein S5]-alanine N-acetyltransferase
MGPFPIETERLLLREFRAEDEAAIHAYAADEEATRFANWGPNTKEQTRAILESWLVVQRGWPREVVPLAIELKTERRLIGGTGFTPLDLKARTAVFGYVLHRSYWGSGYATEASRALLSFGFRELGLHRITAACDTLNTASYHVMEKLGMRREAHHRKDARKHGRWRDTYIYAVLGEEWRG